jgi:hypothetical protein
MKFGTAEGGFYFDLSEILGSHGVDVFWDVAPCSLTEVYRLFRGAYCLHHQGDRPKGL